MSTPSAALTRYFPVRGDDFFYATLRLEKDTKYTLHTLYAFWQEIMAISEQYQNAEVAQAKLGWWQQEVARLYQGEAQHPIAKALAGIVPAFQIKQSQLAAIIEAALLSVDTHIFDSPESLWQHYQHLGGIKLTLLARVLTQNHITPEIEKSLHQLGIALEGIRHLQRFNQFIQRGHLYLPAVWLKAQQLSPEEVIHKPSSYDLTPLFEQKTLFIDEQLQDTLSALSNNAALMPLLIYAKIHQKRLHLLQKKHYPVLTRQLDISPLRKLFTSA